MIQRHVAEQVLAGEGLSHRDIHGVDRDTVTVSKRYDLAASLRRVCAACGRRRVFGGVSVGAVVAGVVAAYTASVWVAVITIGLALSAFAVLRAPEWAFDRPKPAYAVSNTQSDGMTDRDVALRLAVVNERAEYRQELIDKEQKKAEHDARNESNRVRF